MPKSLAFWSSPPKNAGFRGKIENVLDMASAKYRDLFQYLKKKAYREVLYKAKKKFAKKFEYDSKLESLFYVAKEKDGTALRRLVITEEEKAGVFELSATLLLFLDTPAAIILLGKSKSGFTGLTTTRTQWKWLVTNFIYLPKHPLDRGL